VYLIYCDYHIYPMKYQEFYITNDIIIFIFITLVLVTIIYRNYVRDSPVTAGPSW